MREREELSVIFWEGWGGECRMEGKGDFCFGLRC